MVKPTQVLSPAGDYEEALQRYARHLGKDKMRRHVFNEIYGPKRKPRSKKQIMEDAGIRNERNKAQQVQNALEYLSKHHLIERQENNGHTQDGSHYVYGKAEFIRANKESIIRHADNPQAAKNLPTKRNRSGQATAAVAPVKQVTKKDLKKRKQLNVLYLTANPDPTTGTHLRVDAEYRMVLDEVKRSEKFRDSINIVHIPAADIRSLIQGLNQHHPQIVHFSGHGSETGIETDAGKIDQSSSRPLSFDLLAKALESIDNPPEVVVLNSCNSSAAKDKLLPKVNILIAMGDSVSDVVAANFAKHFFAAIASGQSIQSAFNQCKVFIEYDWFNEAGTPELHCAEGVYPSEVVLT